MGWYFLTFLLAFPEAFVRVGSIEPPSAITILISEAGVPDKVLSQAKETAAYIISHTGLEVTFLDCPTTGSMDDNTREACGRQENARFRLRIVKRRFLGLSQDTLGFSLLSGAGGSAYVVYPEVEKFAQDLFPAIEQDDYDDAVILTAAMSHEIGHLLLGADAHSKNFGVMCSQWRRQHIILARQGRLLFTSEQAARMRAEVRKANR